MAKTRIIVDGEEVEIDFETLTDEQAQKYGIHINRESPYVLKRFKLSKFNNRIIAAIPLICVMTYLLLGFLVDKGWTYGLLVFVAIPTFSVLLSSQAKGWKAKFISIMSLLIVIGVILLSIYLPGAVAWAWVLLLLIPIISILAG